MIWDRLTSAQVAALDKNIPVLLPLAATEQHGAHLPLATDRLIAEHFGAALESAISDSVLILPCVACGCSDHHMDFQGTLTLRHSTFLSVVKDMVTAVLSHGFRKVILFNSHGGNQSIIGVAAEQLGYENPAAVIVSATWWTLVRESLKEISETGRGGTGHACEFETSLMLVIAPELVRMNEIAPRSNVAGFAWAEGDMLHGVRAQHYRTMKSMAPNGVYGDPDTASAEKGVKITERVVRGLEEVVMDVQRQEHPFPSLL